MHNTHRGARRRHAHPDDQAERRLGGHPHNHHHRGRGGRHRQRAVDHGEVRLLVLALLAEAPRHGYELMKAVEERSGGAYSPSPGVIYPTLAALEDMGHATADPAASGRRRYRITPEGEAQLAARRTDVDALLARIATGGRRGPPPGTPDAVLAGMDSLKQALRRRMERGIAPEPAAAIQAILEQAATAIDNT